MNHKCLFLWDYIKRHVMRLDSSFVEMYGLIWIYELEGVPHIENT